jgi:hypothetical protein
MDPGQRVTVNPRLVKSRELLENPVGVIVASGERLEAKERGNVTVTDGLDLSEVLVVDGLEESLISTHQLTSDGYTVLLRTAQDWEISVYMQVLDGLVQTLRPQ